MLLRAARVPLARCAARSAARGARPPPPRIHAIQSARWLATTSGRDDDEEDEIPLARLATREEDDILSGTVAKSTVIYESDQSFKFKALSLCGGVYTTCWLAYVGYGVKHTKHLCFWRLFLDARRG